MREVGTKARATRNQFRNRLLGNLRDALSSRGLGRHRDSEPILVAWADAQEFWARRLGLGLSAGRPLCRLLLLGRNGLEELGVVRVIVLLLVVVRGAREADPDVVR